MTSGAVAQKMYTRAALLATMKVVEWVEAFQKRLGKRVLCLLAFASGHDPKPPAYQPPYRG